MAGRDAPGLQGHADDFPERQAEPAYRWEAGEERSTRQVHVSGVEQQHQSAGRRHRLHRDAL